MLRLYKMSDSTVFKQKETGLATSLRYFRTPVMQGAIAEESFNLCLLIAMLF